MFFFVFCDMSSDITWKQSEFTEWKVIQWLFNGYLAIYIRQGRSDGGYIGIYTPPPISLP